VLTKSGLVIRKDASAESKIHHLFTFHRPFSLTPSDMLSIGQNGVALFGSSPVSLNKDQSNGTWYEVKLHEGTTSTAARSKFEDTKTEISFSNREDMNDWIDAILVQYESIYVNSEK
jgi:hypothetical protein